MLKIAELTVNRGSKTVLNSINLQIHRGAGHALVGPNGSGKTSLLLAALGVIPFEGEISRGFTSRSIGVIWQDRGLPLNVGVKSWLKYLADIYQSPIDVKLVEQFGLTLDSRPIRSLSGGQQQKVAIVSAFAHNPEMLILDEPTVGLDEKSRALFVNLCSERISNGASILLTSHNRSDISEIATSITDLASY
jgi:ABC-2 type transport system ATP-binding protein